MQTHEITLLEALRQLKRIFFKFTCIISLCMMRELELRFISFSVFQFIFENFDWGTEVYHFMDLTRGTKELTQI